MFSLVNVLHNYDDITYFALRYGTGMESGRWALTYIGDIFGKVWGWPNTPYLDGLMFILLLSVTAWFIMDLFRINSRKQGLLIGMALITFPATVSTLFFKYTAVYYGMAILLSVGAVWILEKSRYGWFLAVWCIAVSLGLYQAYLPLTISLMVIMLIFKVLKDDYSFVATFKRGLYYCIVLIAGVALYFAILKLSLAVFNTELLDYQGVSQMGQMDAATVAAMVVRAIKEFIAMPFQDYCMLAPNNLIKLGYKLIFVISLVLILYTAISKKNIGKLAMVLVLLLCLPLAVNFIVIMCPNSYIYTLMVFSFVVLLIIPVVLYDCVDKSWKPGDLLRKVAFIILAVMMLNYAYIANVNYQTMYYADRQTENYLSSMLTQVRMTDGYRIYMPWAFIGDRIEDPTFNNYAANNLMYGGNAYNYINDYSRNSWLRAYMGFDIPCTDENTRAMLAQDERVKEMPCYPENGSIKVVDGVVVIKLQNME